jgi:hypothetical protein
MAGGIAISLLVIIGVAALILGIAMYVTGGALWFSRTGSRSDDISGESQRFERSDDEDHEEHAADEPTHGHVVGKPRGRG